MSEIGKTSELSRYPDIVLSVIEDAYPNETTKEKYRSRVLSGIPKEVRTKCGYIDTDVAIGLSQRLSEKVERVTSANDNGNGHSYLNVSENDLIIDPTAGQFIPQSSRVGYETNFTGNMYIGNRNTLRRICMNGVINTSTQNDPDLSFKRIWGETSRVKIV